MEEMEEEKALEAMTNRLYRPKMGGKLTGVQILHIVALENSSNFCTQ
jgi:hypothetical protein